MDPQSAPVEQRAARIASRAHGNVTRVELLGAGVSAEQIRRRVRQGLLIPKYPGVYRLGHTAPSVLADYMAAVKACGEGAVLSGCAAGYLLGLLKGEVPPPEVTTPKNVRIRGLATRRSASIERTTFKLIPVTTVPATLVDLASVLSLDALALAAHEANVKYRTTPRQVQRALARRPRTKGAKNLRAVMEGGVPVSLSKLERRFLGRCDEIRRPRPLTNRVVSEHRVDCHWPEHKLTVELDSYRFHNSRHSWEKDRERERAARRREDEFRRFTWYDVFEDPAYMFGELNRLLPETIPGPTETRGA